MSSTRDYSLSTCRRTATGPLQIVPHSVGIECLGGVIPLAPLDVGGGGYAPITLHISSITFHSTTPTLLS